MDHVKDMIPQGKPSGLMILANTQGLNLHEAVEVKLGKSAASFFSLCK